MSNSEFNNKIKKVKIIEDKINNFQINTDKLKIIDKIYKNKYCKLKFDVITLYFILLWESYCNVVLIQNNIAGLVYKDFGCNNWRSYLESVNEDLKKNVKMIFIHIKTILQ